MTKAEQISALKTAVTRRHSRGSQTGWLGFGALALASVMVAGLTGCGEPAPAAPADGSGAGAAPATAEKPADAKTPPGTPETKPETKPAPTAEKPADPPPPPPPPVDETVDPNQVDTVRKLVDDSISSDEKVSQPAIDRLKTMGSLAAVPLAEIIDKDLTHSDRRIAAMDQLESLKFMTNPRATRAVIGALSSSGAENAELKQHAIGVCGRQKLKDAMPALKTIMNDPAQKSLRVFAAQALVELGDPDAMALAKTLLESTDPIVRSRAVYMIRKEGDPKQLKLLAPLAKDPDPDVRTEVVEACGEVGDVEAVEVLAIMLDDKKHEIVRDTCKHLKRITGVNIARDPEKWKEWYTQEFTPKGKAAFGKNAEAKPGPEVKPKGPTVKKQIRPVPPEGGGANMPPPPPGDGDGLGEEPDGK